MNDTIQWMVVIRLLVGLSVLIPLARQAQALPPRPPPPVQVFVSVSGSDQNPCLQAFPCRNVEAALSVVGNGGEVWIVDSGDFNQVTVNITKSVTIQAVPGALANLWATAGAPAVQINVPGGTVALRNLTITSNPATGDPSGDGVDISNAAAVSIENCEFADLQGIAISATFTSAAVHVADSTFRNVSSWAVSAAIGPTVDITGSRLLHTGGVLANSNATGAGAPTVTTSVSVTDTTISDGNTGVAAEALGPTAIAQAFVTRSTIVSTLYALEALSTSRGAALVTVSDSSITHNQSAFSAIGSPATVRSLGNNYIADNVLEQGMLTPTPLR
jgi:hypothetical protein